MEPTPDYIARAWADLKQGRVHKLLPRLKRQLAASPDDAPLRLLHGLALDAIGRRADARVELETAVRLDPRDTRALLALGTCQSRLREYAAAISTLREVVRLLPQSARPRRLLAHALRRTGDLAGAVTAATDALGLAPGDDECLFELGLAHWVGGNPAASLPHLQQALERAPRNVLRAAAVASVAAELDAPARLAGMRDTRRIALHMNRPFHHHILEPLFRALLPRHEVLLTSEPGPLTRFAPDIIVCADAQGSRLRELVPRATLVFVRHGLILKRHLGVASSGCDYVAGVSSDYLRDMIVATEGLAADRLWVTGHVPMDALFRGQRQPLPPGLLSGSRTILYAPTWNPRMSSVRLLGRDTVTALRGADEDINLIIKPHPVVARDLSADLRLLRRAVRDRANVWLVEEEHVDALALLPHAGVLVSDASSVIMAGLALDLPLVLINHPLRHRDPGFDPDGIEWRWRDMGEEITDIATLSPAIRRVLADPGARAAQRARYRQLLFGNLTDGRAAERIADRLGALPRAARQ